MSRMAEYAWDMAQLDPETLVEIDIHNIDRAADNFAQLAHDYPMMIANYRDGLADLGARLTAIAAELPRLEIQ